MSTNIEPKYMRTDAEFHKVLDMFSEHKACAVLRTPIVGACTPAGAYTRPLFSST